MSDQSIHCPHEVSLVPLLPIKRSESSGYNGFILLVQFGLLSGHLLGNSCPLGLQFVLIVFCLFEIFIYFPFGFKSGICRLVAPVPVYCFSITFT